MRLDQYFPPERLGGMQEHLQKIAAHFGIHDLKQSERIPNTRRALALAEVARDEGKLDAYRDRAMHAHWRDGMDLENDTDLRTIARDAGLSDDAVDRSKNDPRYLARIDDTREEASEIGVRGIPTFILGTYGLSGAQQYDAFVQLAEAAGAQRRTQE
jgi:predicted DsbA family dithiol-disulfide isomerase